MEPAGKICPCVSNHKNLYAPASAGAKGKEKKMRTFRLTEDFKEATSRLIEDFKDAVSRKMMSITGNLFPDALFTRPKNGLRSRFEHSTYTECNFMENIADTTKLHLIGAYSSILSKFDQHLKGYKNSYLEVNEVRVEISVNKNKYMNDYTIITTVGTSHDEPF